VLAPEHRVEPDDDQDGAEDAAEEYLLGEDEGAHDCHDDHHQRAERRREHRPRLLDHQALHVVRYARRHNAGVRGGEEVHVEADGPDGGAVLHGEGDDDGLQGADEADEGGEGERRRVLLQGVRLEDEEGGPPSPS